MTYDLYSDEMKQNDKKYAIGRKRFIFLQRQTC